jgi:hypothetical protein
MGGTTITLEALDAVRQRTGASYGACYEALRATDGDVVAAVVRLESQGRPAWRERLEGLGRSCADQLQAVAREVARTRLAVRQGERRLTAIPAAAAVLGALLVPGLAAAGLLAAIATRTEFTLEREPAPA